MLSWKRPANHRALFLFRVPDLAEPNRAIEIATVILLNSQGPAQSRACFFVTLEEIGLMSPICLHRVPLSTG